MSAELTESFFRLCELDFQSVYSSFSLIPLPTAKYQQSSSGSLTQGINGIRLWSGIEKIIQGMHISKLIETWTHTR